MARTKRVLPGLSRSSACSKTKSCQRLDGHKGPHRASLHAAVTKSPVSRPVGDKVAKVYPPKEAVRRTIVLDGVEYHLVPAFAPTKSAKVTVEKGVEVLSADRYEVPTEAVKAPAKARRPKVRKVAFVAPKERVGVSGPVGQHRTARRAKAAPVGTKSRSNANALKGRV